MALSTSELQDQSRSEVPVQTVTNNIYGNLIAKCCATKQNLVLPPYTTLNEKHGVLAEQSIGLKNGGDFKLGYFCIGIQGSDCDGKTSIGTTRLKVNQHQPIDMDLFKPIPICVRPLGEDLNNVDRELLRIRTIETLLDGNQWIVYWAMVINFDSYDPSVNRIVRDADGNETPNPYTPVKDDLFNPQPVDFTSENTVPVSNTFLNSSAILDCSLNQRWLNEIASACKLMFGDTSYGSINEVMQFWGIDTKTDGLIANGATIRYTEVMSAVAAHMTTERDGRNVISNTKIQLAFDHGASEPMLLHTNATGTPGNQGN